jgi:hypothetical protein
MQNDTSELDQMQTAYKVAIKEWIAAIKQEEALASVNHSVAEVDKWEGAHFTEDKIRNKGEGCEEEIRRRAARKVLWLLNRNNAIVFDTVLWGRPLATRPS